MTVFQGLHMPSLNGATGWLNSGPLAPPDMRGHVVLVNFWTLTCVNSLRQEPYIRAWAQTYRDDGLVVIGVHTPEFSFERAIDRVGQATVERGIGYPVAVDSDYKIWRAFDNQHWPALYLLDRDGITRDQHFGEGRYEESERVIQRLLGVERDLVSVEGRGVEAPADWEHLRTPETYVGYSRSQGFASRDRAALGARRPYALPDRLRVNHWALAGEWTIGRESIVLERAGGRIAHGSTHATRISCCPRRGATRSRSACSSTVRPRACPQAWTSTRRATPCSGTGACTSSCASRARSASGRCT
jgi:thiol-disulfide isomerase/thioredoxin